MADDRTREANTEYKLAALNGEIEFAKSEGSAAVAQIMANIEARLYVQL